MQHPVNDCSTGYGNISPQLGEPPAETGDRPTVVHMTVGNKICVRGTIQQLKGGKTICAVLFGMSAAIQQNSVAVARKLKTIRAHFTAAAQHGKIDTAI